MITIEGEKNMEGDRKKSERKDDACERERGRERE